MNQSQKSAMPRSRITSSSLHRMGMIGNKNQSKEQTLSATQVNQFERFQLSAIRGEEMLGWSAENHGNLDPAIGGQRDTEIAAFRLRFSWCKAGSGWLVRWLISAFPTCTKRTGGGGEYQIVAFISGGGREMKPRGHDECW
ncbi:unnamed protein product, partial [Musa hybrid cultivar]